MIFEKQLSAQVFIGVLFTVGRRVQPKEKGCVADHAVKQLAKGRAGQLPEDTVLATHDLHVPAPAGAGGEVVVPHER